MDMLVAAREVESILFDDDFVFIMRETKAVFLIAIMEDAITVLADLDIIDFLMILVDDCIDGVIEDRDRRRILVKSNLT